MYIDEFADAIKNGHPQYQKIYIPKRGGGSRDIFIPNKKTLLIQKAVLRDLKSLIDFPPCVTAFRKGISILDNAKAHLGNAYMIRYDIMNFFDTIDKDRVKTELKRRNFDASLIKVILKWCFGGGHLPQGAPASPFLANLVCTNLDKRFSALTQMLGATYIRYADDITISGDKEIVKYQTLFKRIILTEKFTINYYKTRLTVLDFPASRQDYSAKWFRDCHIVTGLAVDKDSVSVREAYLNELWRKIRDGEDNPSVRGKISFVQSITPTEAAKMYQHFSDGGLKKNFKDNIAAIKILKILESTGRNATFSEQAILAKFNGWGTLRTVKPLRDLLTPEEYNSACEAIKDSFFTAPEIARTIWTGLERMGFKGGKILDPSMGTGIFFGTMPRKIAPRSKLVGVERDNLTGRIAQQLYPQADVKIADFSALKLPANRFNLAISNVPFDAVSDSGIHDYFFVKTLDALKPGGLTAFITSTYTLDNREIKDKLESAADLIAAFKLPNTAFAEANTQVTSDLVIFQKRVDPKKTSEYAQPWHEVGELVTDTGQKFTVNEYFINHREHMIGTPMEDPLYGGRDRLALNGTGHDVAKELGELMNNLPENIYTLKQ